MALYMAILVGGTPIGAPIVGAVADGWGPRWALGVGAVAGRCRRAHRPRLARVLARDAPGAASARPLAARRAIRGCPDRRDRASSPRAPCGSCATGRADSHGSSCRRAERSARARRLLGGGRAHLADPPAEDATRARRRDAGVAVSSLGLPPGGNGRLQRRAEVPLAVGHQDGRFNHTRPEEPEPGWG